jgi:hypothetical protein
MVWTDAAACARTEERRNGKLASTRMRRQIGELHRKIKAQVVALKRGIEPELVSARIAELRGSRTLSPTSARSRRRSSRRS